MFKVLFVGLLLSSVSPLCAEEIRVNPESRSDLKITIYNESLALVKDKRAINFVEGINDIAYIGVSSLIKPETALLKGAGIKVLEQNFNYDLLSPENILSKSVGKKVTIIDTFEDGKTKEVEAEVLSTNSGVVYKIGDKIETNPRGRVIFSEIPKNLRDKPTLVLSLLSEKEKKEDVELSYLTAGLSWKADYIAELDANDENMAISGLVTLNNNSGVAYENTSLQLVAGDVNLVRPMMNREVLYAKTMRAPTMGMDIDGAMVEETFADYHLYSLPRKVDILNNQTKQVAMLSANGVGVEKEYVYENLFRLYRNSNSDFRKVNPDSILKFENKTENNLGLPLPKGVIRVYKSDLNGNVLFVGEDNINHTPKNEEVKITMGKAFDITAEGAIVESSSYQKRYDATFEIKVKNAKNTSVVVKIEQDFPINTTIDDESYKSEQFRANSRRWEIEVPAEKETKLRVKFHSQEMR